MLFSHRTSAGGTVPLKAELETRVGIPTFVDNDVNVGTLGEHVFGAGQGVQNVVGIFVGTGIGGGIILQGELFHGASKTAGEIGHIIVKAGGPRCGCGTRGCLEALASRTAMTKQFQKAILKKGKKSVLSKLTDGDLRAIRSGVLAKAIRSKDKLTLKVFKKVTKYLGIGIGSIVNFLNPEMVILGGGVVEALDDTFLDNIRAAAEKYALPNTLDGVQIVRAELGDNSGILGRSSIGTTTGYSDIGEPRQAGFANLQAAPKPREGASMLVDDNREEHRMMIFGNDSRLVQERLIVEYDAQRDGILAQKVHEDSYTVTLYVLLKDYGLTPVFRIKPRIRFHRSNYDNLSSSAPLQYSFDDIIHFAELKRGVELTEKIDDLKLAEILGDAPALKDITDDAALQLVSQRDVSLRNPPFQNQNEGLRQK